MKHKLRNSQSGFAVVEVLAVAVVLAGISFLGYKAYTLNASAAVAPTQTLNVAYGTDPAQKLDIHAPAVVGTSPALRTAIVMVHGGGWVNGDKSGSSNIATYYATNVPAVVFNVNYRLGTAGKYPNAVNDVKAALAWVKANAATYKVDTSRIGLHGESAGGHLAGMLMDQGGIKAFVGWSGVYDFPLTETDPFRFGGTRVAPSNAQAVNFLGCTYAACPETWVAGSPVNHVVSAVALQLVSSTAEPIPLSQMYSLKTAQQAAGGTVETYEVPGSTHGKALNTSTLPTGAIVKNASKDFFKAKL